MLPGYSESSYEADYSIIYELLSLISFDFSTVVVLSIWPITSPTPHPRIKALGQVSHCVMHITDEIPLIAVGSFFCGRDMKVTFAGSQEPPCKNHCRVSLQGRGCGEALADFPLMLLGQIAQL